MPQHLLQRLRPFPREAASELLRLGGFGDAAAPHFGFGGFTGSVGLDHLTLTVLECIRWP